MNIYVGNIPYRLSEEDLKELFQEYGTVESVKKSLPTVFRDAAKDSDL